MSKKSDKKYNYEFSYYWACEWYSEADFDKDSKSLRSMKSRIKRHFKTDENGVTVYINLKFVTTQGKMNTNFPTCTRIWSCNAEVYEAAVARSKMKKDDHPNEDNKIILKKIEAGPESTATQIQVTTPTTFKGKRKVSFNPDNEDEPKIKKSNVRKAAKPPVKNMLQYYNYDMIPAETDVTNNYCKSPDNDQLGDKIEPQEDEVQVPEDKTGNNIEEFFSNHKLLDLDKVWHGTSNFVVTEMQSNLLDVSKEDPDFFCLAK